MTRLITLIAHLEEIPPVAVPAPPAHFIVRPSSSADLDQLASLYFGAYDPGVACGSLKEATDDIKASFQGEYGEYWHEASPVVEVDGRIVSAAMTVRRAPWDDTPDCPFIIELFTALNHRRFGLARLVTQQCLATIKRIGETAVALRVADDNTPAQALYDSLGFTDWQPRP